MVLDSFSLLSPCAFIDLNSKASLNTHGQNIFIISATALYPIRLWSLIFQSFSGVMICPK